MGGFHSDCRLILSPGTEDPEESSCLAGLSPVLRNEQWTICPRRSEGSCPFEAGETVTGNPTPIQRSNKTTTTDWAKHTAKKDSSNTDTNKI